MPPASVGTTSSASWKRSGSLSPDRGKSKQPLRLRRTSIRTMSSRPLEHLALASVSSGVAA